MGKITPQMVKELRDKTGAGMGACKKALTESEGDIKGAIDYLRKKGAASAAKRADKAAKEGRIFVQTSDDRKTAVILEINCETDFVALNEHFVNYVNLLGNAVMGGNYADIPALMKAEIDGNTIEIHTNDLLAKFSEKIELRRFEKITSDGSIVSYTHVGDKLGVLIDTSANKLNDTALDLVKDIAMQIAAMRPSFVDRTEVDQATLDKEKDIYRTQAIESGKKEEIADRIAEGRLNKFYAESCLIEQQYVKDSKKVVNDVVAEIGKEVGAEVKLNKFYRFALGEELV